MKKRRASYAYILLTVLSLGLIFAPSVQASFLDQLIKDTTELYPKGHPTLFAGAAYDLREPGNSKAKVVSGWKAIAWRCLTLDPGWAYAPKSASEKGAFAFLISLRPTRIPIGRGQELRDRFEELSLSYSWLENLDVGVGASFSLKDELDTEEKRVSCLVKLVYSFRIGS